MSHFSILSILYLAWPWSLPLSSLESLDFFSLLMLASLSNHYPTSASAITISPRHIQFLLLSVINFTTSNISKTFLCKNRNDFLNVLLHPFFLVLMLCDITAGFGTPWHSLLTWHLQQWIKPNWHLHGRMKETKIFEIVLKY